MSNNQAHPGEPLAVTPPPPEEVASRLRTFQVADGERRGRRRPRRRRWPWVVVLAAIAGGWAVWLHQASGNVPEVETYTFSGKAARDVLLDLNGFVVPRNRIVISTQVGGIVAKIHLPAEGQKVKEGALLFEVEDTRYRADYLQAEAGLAVAKAQLLELENGTREEEKEQAIATLEQARAQMVLMSAEWERDRKVYETRAISRADLEKSHKAFVEAQMSVRSQLANYNLVRKGPRDERIVASRGEVQRAQATRDRAKYACDQTRIYAPADGKGTSFTLLERKVAVGESIQADLTYTALCTLADLTQMEAEVEVQERDLAVLKIGAPCEIIPDAYSDRVYQGKVNRKQPIVNRQRGVVQVKITIDHPDEYLLPDMNARVLLLKTATRTTAAEELPEIPLRTLVPGSDSPAVFVLEGQTARLRPIETGATAGERIQVRKGLQPEELIILLGDRPLRDGQPVRVRGEDKAKGNGRKEH